LRKASVHTLEINNDVNDPIRRLIRIETDVIVPNMSLEENRPGATVAKNSILNNSPKRSINTAMTK
jgi:hypothetical protein